MTSSSRQESVKLLLDTCVWGGACQELETAGYDVIWSGDWDTDPGDEEILAQAHAEDRIIVTLDKDFGELVIVRGKPHHGIVRLVGIPARQQAKYCLFVCKHYSKELEQGAILTVQRERVRIRLPERASG